MNKIHLQPATIDGLIITFLLVPVFLYLYPIVWPVGSLTNTHLVIRELGIFAIAGILILIIFKGEGKGLDSVGLYNGSWLKSVWLALLIIVVSIGTLLLTLAVFGYLGISFGDGAASKKYDDISLWVMTLIVLRAGIVEELFYRGYIIERLEKLSRSWVVTILLPSIIFGLFHYKQGIGGIIISFLIGMIMAIAYWKKKRFKSQHNGAFYD